MRLRITAAAVAVSAVGTLAFTGVAHGATDERDCADFSTQRQAQAVLDSPAGDPQRLDADRDGQACEIWFANRAGAGATVDPTAAATPTAAGLSSSGPARQVSPVPRGGVDTGRDTTRPGRSHPAPPAILLAAAFAVAGTAAAGAAAAAARPAVAGARTRSRAGAAAVPTAVAFRPPGMAA